MVDITSSINTFISKYKPYYISDFYTDENFQFVLNTLFEIDNLNVLFVGNPSSGKTTLLYAIIRQYYGLSKDSTFPENNILHINNLKEQGINYFRNEMKTFCRSSSTIFGKKKLLIIDDIDMINEQSQQVFRNYIDKYKNNVNFISVCTNIQKVIESIQSRTHIITLEPPTKTHFQIIMDKIIQQENLVLSEDIKSYIIQISNNSIRNLINYLEKIYIYVSSPDATHLDLENCKKLCNIISVNYFEKYITHLKTGQITEAIHILYSIHDYGYSVIDILDYFFNFVKTTESLNEDEKYHIIPVICNYITIFHNVHEDSIELALFTNNIYKVLLK
uniref:AAA+ ATPase domain-containing protein n=1 Tax=viral metagenome TaxID=1070528 RepID=A0A6C0HHN4_9ZZZZ